MTGDLRAAGAQLARQAAERQGLSPTVDDPATLRRVATLAGLTPRTRERRPVGGRDGVRDPRRAGRITREGTRPVNCRAHTDATVAPAGSTGGPA